MFSSNNSNMLQFGESPLKQASQQKSPIIPLPSQPQSNQDDGMNGLLKGLGSLIGSKPKQSTQDTTNQPVIGGLTSVVGNQPNQFTPSSQVIGSGIGLNDLYQRPAFKTALQAQQEAFKTGVTKSPVMTVVDYSIPSDQPRLWVVDTKQNKVLMNTYVAHGSGSGTDSIPKSFSNEEGSHASSLGTYVTGDTYYGKNGYSEQIKGLDKGINDNAFKRAVVVHGADYVGKDKHGTSWGCFAVPGSDAPKLIGLTKGGTIIHAYAPDQQSINNFSQNLSAKGAMTLHQSISGFGQNTAQPSNDLTMNTIKSFEGFSDKPYWDVNAYRSGFGTDTITRADGSVIPVRKGTIVTQADANRDLQRRIPEFQNTIQKQIGSDIWNKFPEPTKAALTSIAYNYGSLPKSLIPAAKSGDLNALQKAVSGLANDNKGINSKRRLQEASMIRPTAMNNVPNQPHYLPNVKAFDHAQPIRTLNSMDIDAIMRFEGGGTNPTPYTG